MLPAAENCCVAIMDVWLSADALVYEAEIWQDCDITVVDERSNGDISVIITHMLQ